MLYTCMKMFTQISIRHAEEQKLQYKEQEEREIVIEKCLSAVKQLDFINVHYNNDNSVIRENRKTRKHEENIFYTS
jgi:hypothetical protein